MAEQRTQAFIPDQAMSSLMEWKDVNDLDEVGNLILEETHFDEVRQKVRAIDTDDLDDKQLNNLILGIARFQFNGDPGGSDDAATNQIMKEIKPYSDGWREQPFLFVVVLGGKPPVGEQHERECRAAQIKNFQTQFNKPDAVTTKEAHTTDEIVQHVGDFLYEHPEKPSLRVIILGHGKIVEDQGALSTKDQAANGDSPQNSSGYAYAQSNAELQRRLAECVEGSRPACAGETLPCHFYYCFAKRGAPSEEKHKDQLVQHYDKKEQPTAFEPRNNPSTSEHYSLKGMGRKLNKAEEKLKEEAEQERLTRDNLRPETGNTGTEMIGESSASGVQPEVSTVPNAQPGQEDNLTSAQSSLSSLLPNSTVSPEGHPSTTEGDSEMPSDEVANVSDKQLDPPTIQGHESGPAPATPIRMEDVEGYSEEFDPLSDTPPQRKKKVSRWQKFKQNFSCASPHTS